MPRNLIGVKLHGAEDHYGIQSPSKDECSNVRIPRVDIDKCAHAILPGVNE